MAPDTLKTVLHEGHLEDARQQSILGYDQTSVADDMFCMHGYFGVHEAIAKLDTETLKKFLDFRFNFLQEEIDEGRKAIAEKNADDVVDALIDLVVIAVGTLDLFEVDFDESWNRVLKANLAKKVGANANRPNEFSLPDLIKPPGWEAPTHVSNLGLIGEIFES
jgi:hypothetical protein